MTDVSPRSPYTRTELVWAGKRTRVDRVAIPFQHVERINAPRGADLFSGLDARDGWRNKLIWGDNKLVMASLLQGDPAAGIEPLAGKVDLIYIDPPFDTGADFSVRTQIGEEQIEKEPSILEQLAYRDTWGQGTDSYLQMMYERFLLMHQLLTDTGSIYVHVDNNIGPYVRLILDNVLGAENFINCITWKRSDAHSDIGQGAIHLGRITDSIYYYSNTPEQQTLNMEYTPLPESTAAKWYRHVEEETGRRYNKADVTGPGGAKKGNPVYEWNGTTRAWRYSKSRMEELEKAGRLVYSESGMVYQKRYLDESRGVPLQDLWDDIKMIRGIHTASEGLNYATQKPAALLERIISLSSNPGDLVADFFLGSGTTAAVAHKLGRRWIGCDLGRFAIHTSRKRLLDLGATFDVYNLGKYERSHWQGVTLGEQLRAYVDFILALYRAEPVPGFKHLHGKKAARAVHVGAVDAPVTFAEIGDVLAECRATHTRAVDILGWEWEMGVNQQAPQQAEGFGVDLTLYQIPNDVMDRRARAEDVKFYSLAYVEAEIRTVQARTVQVELKDFVIPDMDLIPQAVRDKITRWSDFIDYWSVDFDYREATFCNAWQGFRTRARRTLDTVSGTYTYEQPGTYTVVIKVVDVFGIDSTKEIEVTV